MSKDTYFILDIEVKGELRIVTGLNERAALARAKLRFGEFEVVRRQTQIEYLREMGI